MRTNANWRRQVYGVRAKIIAPIEILDQKKEEEKRKEGNAINPIDIVADHHRHSSDHLDLPSAEESWIISLSLSR